MIKNIIELDNELKGILQEIIQNAKILYSVKYAYKALSSGEVYSFYSDDHKEYYANIFFPYFPTEVFYKSLTTKIPQLEKQGFSFSADYGMVNLYHKDETVLKKTVLKFYEDYVLPYYEAKFEKPIFEIFEDYKNWTEEEAELILLYSSKDYL